MIGRVKFFFESLSFLKGKRGLESFNDAANIASVYPPGHFYSPIPSRNEILEMGECVFENSDKKLGGIDLNEDRQFILVKELAQYYENFPYHNGSLQGFRYNPDNHFYYDSDAFYLYSMMRHFKPKRIVEIGSGHSSALMLDVNQLFLENNVDFCFIDPYPERLESILKVSDNNIKIIKKRVQDVEISLFEELGKNDFIFVDSSHVSKIGSDVNHIFFKVLPEVKDGVLIHFHDVFHPFVYPKDWVLNGRCWNEVFLLRAFLQYNKFFKIILFNNFLEKKHEEWFNDNMPLCLKTRSRQFSKTGSIWMKKICVDE